ncbi:MAG: outer rane receptor protein mostly Fe transport [Microbacterium sp.]|jgi:hypothetical protein|nr:outer rane receptor protein mostly Fe transport [Microbacterium sp.]
MKRALVPGVLVLLLALSACSGTETTGGRSDATPAATTTQAGAERAATQSPEVPAQPVEVSAAPEQSQGATDVLVAIQLTVADYGVDATADQIKAASDYTCDQLDSGADRSGIVALTGDIPPLANEALVQLSADSYCPIR